jgi:hypothetical protein
VFHGEEGSEEGGSEKEGCQESREEDVLPELQVTGIPREPPRPSTAGGSTKARHGSVVGLLVFLGTSGETEPARLG